WDARIMPVYEVLTLADRDVKNANNHAQNEQAIDQPGNAATWIELAIEHIGNNQEKHSDGKRNRPAQLTALPLDILTDDMEKAFRHGSVNCEAEYCHKHRVYNAVQPG